MGKRLLVAGLTILLLGSCGGGGGGGSSSPDSSSGSGSSGGSGSTGGSGSSGGGGSSGGSGSSGGTTPSNSQPAFSSSTSFSVVENNTAAGTIEADDEDSDDTLALSIEGGADADLFELGVCNASRCTSNSLSFKTAPNFEAPGDVSGDNVYEVTLGAYDGTVTVTQDVSITVTNAVEGRVVDAPLSNATVCLDTNEDSECGTDETNVSSDSQGYYALAETVAQSGFELRVLSIGGTDILTNKELPSLALIAEVPVDASQAVAVTPLSTVVSVATDPASVLVALGFPETVTPDEITSIDPWALATDSTESSGEFANSTALAESIGITTTELESVADNVVTTSVQIANLIQTADAVVTDTTTSGVQSAAERAAMITSTVTKELVETIDAAVASAGSASAASVDLGDATVTNEVLKETAEESATLIVAEIEAKQTAGTLDLSDTNDTTVAAILQIKETQEVIIQTGLDSTQTANITAIAATAAETNALIKTQVASAGVSVLTTASSAEDIAGIVANTSTLAEQLVTGEITTDTFTTSSDVDTQASASGGLNDSIATFVDTDGDGIFDANDAFPNDPSETLDTDGDGVGNNADAFPSLASETKDTDSDGVGDNADAFPNDATETLDSDGDGVGDNADAFPNDAAETLDSDGDGVGDNSDVFPNDAAESLDTDGDGLGNNADTDDDSDGFSDLLETTYGSIPTDRRSALSLRKLGNTVYGSVQRVYQSATDGWPERAGSVAISGSGEIFAFGGPRYLGIDPSTGSYFDENTAENYVGRVRVFKLDGNTWEQLGGEILGDSRGNQFGYAVSLNNEGNILAVGTADSANPGYVRVYELVENNWVQLGKTLQPNKCSACNEGLYGDRFGFTVSLDRSGKRLAVGAHMEEKGPTRIYDWDGLRWDLVGEPIVVEDDNYAGGYQVELSGDANSVIVGVPRQPNGTKKWAGGARVYKFSDNSWSQVGETIFGEGQEDEATHVSINNDGSVIAMGAHFNDTAGSNAGHLRIFTLNDDNWTQKGSTLYGAEGDHFGGIVSLSDDGESFAVTSRFSEGGGFTDDAGSMRLYFWRDENWQLIDTVYGREDNSYIYQAEISADGATVVFAGAYASAENGDRQAGQAFVYQLATDSDSDGVVDIYDPYPFASLGGLLDVDGDGRPDVCDSVCQALGMTVDLDIDGDGVPDALDAEPRNASEFCGFSEGDSGSSSGSAGSNDGQTVQLGSGIIKITDYLDGLSSNPAIYNFSMSESSAGTVDLGVLSLDLDNLNALLAGSGGKSPDLSLVLSEFPAQGNTGTVSLTIALTEGVNSTRGSGERSIVVTVDLAWQGTSSGLSLTVPFQQAGVVLTTTDGVAISSDWDIGGSSDLLLVTGDGVQRPLTLDLKLLEFLSSNISQNGPALTNFFSEGNYHLSVSFNGITLRGANDENISNIQGVFGVSKTPLPSVYVKKSTVSENSSVAKVTITLSHFSSDTRIDYQTISNSANAEEDFSAIFGTITASDIEMVAGTPTAEIQIPIVKDAALCESDEDFSVLLASSNAVFDDPVIRITITDEGTSESLGDKDGDGIRDFVDAFPLDPSESIDSDKDGIGNNADGDDDNDGLIDSLDAFPLDATETTDSDGDGVGDNSDAFPNDATETLDSDADGVGNNLDSDDDGDGISDPSDQEPLDAFPLDPSIASARTINLDELPRKFFTVHDLKDPDITFTSFGGLFELGENNTVRRINSITGADATGSWAIEANQLKLSGMMAEGDRGLGAFLKYDDTLTNLDSVAWSSFFGEEEFKLIESEVRTDYSYWLIDIEPGKWEVYEEKRVSLYLLDTDLLVDPKAPVKVEEESYSIKTLYEFEGARLSPFTVEELDKVWPLRVDFDSNRGGGAYPAYDAAADFVEFSTDGTGKTLAQGRSFTWSRNSKGSIDLTLDDTGAKMVIGRYHEGRELSGVLVKGEYNGKTFVNYDFAVPQSITEVEISPLFDQDLLSSGGDPRYRTPSTTDFTGYYGYVLKSDGTMRNHYALLSEYIGQNYGEGNKSFANHPGLSQDGWGIIDYTWSRSGNSLNASGCMYSEWPTDVYGCHAAWWQENVLLSATDNRLVYFQQLFLDVINRDLSKTDDRSLVDSRVVILNAFESFDDVDGDKVKNIYDHYPFDSTRH